MAAITTAVFPVAGLGTRFLPITKSGPKEMLPIVDKPLIQYVVEEAVNAGITRLVFVTSSGKRAIEDYFDTNYELEHRLLTLGKSASLTKVKAIVPNHVTTIYVRQSEPKGLGHAVMCAREVVGDQAFAVLLADDIMADGVAASLAPMIERYASTGSSVLAVEKIDRQDTDKYGIVSLVDEKQTPLQVADIVEKPAPKVAPSELAVIGRYILTPAIFDCLAATEKGLGGEIQLTDAIARLLKQETVLAEPIHGQRFDCGSPLGLLKATLTFALQRPELAEDLKTYIQSSVQQAVI